MTLEELVRQWSKYSGWNLVAEFERAASGAVLLNFKDKKFPGDSTLCIKLMPPPLGLEGGWLKELSGRLRHWGCTEEQYQTLLTALKNFDKETE